MRTMKKVMRTCRKRSRKRRDTVQIVKGDYDGTGSKN